MNKTQFKIPAALVDDWIGIRNAYGTVGVLAVDEKSGKIWGWGENTDDAYLVAEKAIASRTDNSENAVRVIYISLQYALPKIQVDEIL